MKIIRPRTLVGAVCFVWVGTMGLCLYTAEIWASYERLAQRRHVPAGSSSPKPTNLLSHASPVKPGHLAHSFLVTGREWTPSSGTLRSDWGQEPRASEQGVSMRSDSSAYLATKASKDDSARDILQSLATAAAGLCGLAGRELDLFHALIARESTWRHYDAQGRVLRSSAGALGLAQVMPATARDVWQNALAGACTRRRNLDRRGGDHRKALHDYHAGAWRKRTTRATHDYSDDIMRGSAQ